MTQPGRIVFVTGTDTGVGKTFVTAALARGLVARGRTVAALKPIETGIPLEPGPGHVATDAARLAAASGRPGDAGGASFLRFTPPVSPHLAARLAGVAIDPLALAEACRVVAAGVELTFVEGAGGLLAPLRDDGTSMADLALALDARLLVVARAALGTINHSRLTLEAARARGLAVMAVIVNESRPAADATEAATNVRELKPFAGCPVWGPLPFAAAGAAPADLWIESVAPGLLDALLPST